MLVLTVFPLVLLKEMPKFFSKILTPSFNKSLKQGIFPDMLKTAIIVPGYKGGDAMQMTNCRPIAILPAIAKVFEKMCERKNTKLSKSY